VVIVSKTSGQVRIHDINLFFGKHGDRRTVPDAEALRSKDLRNAVTQGWVAVLAKDGFSAPERPVAAVQAPGSDGTADLRREIGELKAMLMELASRQAAPQAVERIIERRVETVVQAAQGQRVSDADPNIAAQVAHEATADIGKSYVEAESGKSEKLDKSKLESLRRTRNG